MNKSARLVGWVSAVLVVVGAVGCGGADSAASSTNASFSVGGTLSGLSGGTSVVLRNNGGDDLTLGANGAFTFSTNLIDGATYSVAVATPPVGQSCAASSGSGTVTSANVASVSIACTTLPLVCKNCFKKRFVYFGGNITKANLAADADFKKLSDLIPRAAAAGYNGIVLDAGGTGSYDYMAVKPSTYYYSNFAAIVKKASDAGSEKRRQSPSAAAGRD